MSSDRYIPAPSLDGVSDDLDLALSHRDWRRAVSLVGEHWPALLDGPQPELLDRALRKVPVEHFDGDPRAAAVRDIRLHSSADAVDRMLGEATLPDANDVMRLESIARTDRGLSLISVAASRMIALRVRGRMSRAIQLAVLVERLGRIAVVHRPDAVIPRLPAALLHAGITRGLADDLDGAVICLRDAYERSASSRAQHVESDAAAKIALFHAVGGDIDLARTWLRRYDEAPKPEGWYRPRVALSGNIARSLVATESLNREEAEATQRLLELPVNAEQSWAPAVSYARARYALAWGDRLGAAKRVRLDQRRYADWLGDGSTFGPLLVNAEVDLLLSTGQRATAGRVVREGAEHHHDHEHGRTALARAAIMDKHWDTASRLARDTLSEARTTRAQVDALVIAVAAAAGRGDRSSTEADLRNLDDALGESGLLLAGMALSRREREQVPGIGARDDVRDTFDYTTESITLTSQQHRILEGLRRGLTLQQIAQEAHLSTNTVKTHRRALFRRLGATNRDDALARAHDRGLI